MYKITLTSQAEKFLLKKLDRVTQVKVSSKIDQLSQDPFAQNPNLTKLKDMDRGYRLRVGNVRVIYGVETSTQSIIIWKIDFRGSIYKP